MLFRMEPEVVQFILQFDDRFFEIELMFHAYESLIVFWPESMSEFGTFLQNERPDLRPASLGDEVYTPSPWRSEGRRDQLGGRCSSRAASKTSLPTLNEQRNPFCSELLTPSVQVCSNFN